MENVQKHFKEKRDDLYSRYRLAKTSEDKQKVIRDMQRFNLEARKYRGVIPPITASSLPFPARGGCLLRESRSSFPWGWLLQLL
jgi:hypothetical protein